MIVYLWVLFAAINWLIFLNYVFKNLKNIEKKKLSNFVAWGLSFSLIFGPIWTLGVILYHVGLYFDKNR